MDVRDRDRSTETDPRTGQYQTFIVRFWQDGSEEPSRGHIQHVASGRGAYFRDLDRMLRFMDDYLLAHPEVNARPAGSGEARANVEALPDGGPNSDASAVHEE